MSEPEAIFISDAGAFRPTELAGSPWGPGLLHGGPPAGLLARAIERSIRDPELAVARITTDLFRPVPMEPLHTHTEVVREGRRIVVVRASLFAGEVEVSRATGLALRRTEIALPEFARFATPPPPGPDGIDQSGLTVGSGAPRWKGFHTTIEVRRVEGKPGTGRGIAWIRIPCPFVAGEETSPLVRAAAISDFGNGLGHIHAGEGLGFINVDITMHLHRPPEGEWIGMDVVAGAQTTGIGMNEATLFDTTGPFARVSQSLLANPRATGVGEG
jgi:hypothetical protein